MEFINLCYNKSMEKTTYDGGSKAIIMRAYP